MSGTVFSSMYWPQDFFSVASLNLTLSRWEEGIVEVGAKGRQLDFSGSVPRPLRRPSNA